MILSVLRFLANFQNYFINLLRIAIFIVMVWIGGLKAFQYEADGIVPFVANSPVMSFFYNHPKEYNEHKNKEGEVNKSNIEWNKNNGTYEFAIGLGLTIITIGILTLLGIWYSNIGLIGSLLTVLMSVATLSFLITTPEVYVPNLGGSDFGFPFLSGAGRLVIKDIIMLTSGLLLASDNAKKILEQNNN